MNRLRRRIAAGLLTAVVVVNLALGGAFLGHHFAHPSHQKTTSERSAHFRTLPDQTSSPEQARAKAITALLAQRATAIRQHNRAAFLATLDPGSPAFRKQQLSYFTNLSSVPFASWSYSLDSATTGPTDGSQFLQYAAPVWVPHLELHYAIAGFDRAPTSLSLYYTFVQRGTRWYVGGDNDDADLAFKSARDIWDFGAVTVVRGSRSLVLGHPKGSVSLRALADEADRDVPRVTRVWGRGWAQRVVVLAPNTSTELSALIANGEDLSQIAAVATAEIIEAGHRTTSVGDRVLINPHNYLRLNAKGRQVVITHEITHVASRPATGELEPTWLVEGLADYVGYLDLHVPPPVAAHALQVWLEDGHHVTALPTDSAYNGSNKHLELAYDESWLACRFLAEQWGQSTLVRLYRAVGAARHGSSTSATNAAMQSVLHESLATFTRQWESYVTSVLQ